VSRLEIAFKQPKQGWHLNQSPAAVEDALEIAVLDERPTCSVREAVEATGLGKTRLYELIYLCFTHLTRDLCFTHFTRDLCFTHLTREGCAAAAAQY
jgi:hypothetical protein